MTLLPVELQHLPHCLKQMSISGIQILYYLYDIVLYRFFNYIYLLLL